MTSTTTRPRPRSLPSATTKLNTEYGNLPLRHRLPGRSRGTLRGLRLSRQGGQSPARRHRADLPPGLPAPAAWYAAGRNRGSVPGLHLADALAQPDGGRQHGLRPGAWRRNRPDSQGPPGGSGGGGSGRTQAGRRLTGWTRPEKAHGAVSATGAAPLSLVTESIGTAVGVVFGSLWGTGRDKG